MAALPAPAQWIGAGQTFNGSSQWINVAGNFPTGTAPRCLSVWGKLTAATPKAHLAQYGSSTNLATYGLWDDGGTWTAWHWGVGNDFPSPFKTDGGWHLNALDYDGKTSRFFMDGVLAASAARTLMTRANGFTLGSSFKGDELWSGIIDEVEMAAVSRSADWLKLAYENQRQGSPTLSLEILE